MLAMNASTPQLFLPTAAGHAPEAADSPRTEKSLTSASSVCPSLLRSESSLSTVHVTSSESHSSLVRRRSSTQMLTDVGTDAERNRDNTGASSPQPPRRRRRSLIEPVRLGDGGGLSAQLLKKSSSREKLRELMAAPVIDWGKVLEVQQHHYESLAQRGEAASAPTGGHAAVRRNKSMYCRGSHMRRSLERLDRALGTEKNVPSVRPAAVVIAKHRRHEEIPSSEASLQRNASWCFSNGAGSSGGLGLSQDRRRRISGGSKPAGLALMRKKADAPSASSTAAASLALLKQPREGNATWSLPAEPTMVPSIPLAAKKAAWDMEIKATLNAAKESLLQGEL